MNRAETLALYAKGREAWNAWADELLAKKQALKKAGTWEAKHEAWGKETFADFSSAEAPETFPDALDLNAFHFPGVACFNKATFNGDASFDGAAFDGVASFNGATFNGDAWFNGATFNGDASFDGAAFNGDASFNALHAERAFTLAEANFHVLPNFIQAHFSEAPRLDDVHLPWGLVEPGRFWTSIFKPVKPHVKASYRALRRIAEQGKDHPHELQFWAGELRASRSLKGRNSNGWHNGWRVLYPSWWTNILYEGVSDFGRSLLRPLYLSARRGVGA